MPKMRAAIYARYSTDMQSAASIEDQVRLCRAFCDANGWHVVEVFSDQAMSGATHLRPGFQRMQQAAFAGNFEVLVAEALDRLSRDQEHIAGLHKRMTYNGVKIVTKFEGEINELHIGLGGTMSAMFLRQLSQKTHRGLEGRVKAGKSAGGISYGYCIDRQLRPDGTYTTGDRKIDELEAAVVQRIFRDYDRGMSSRAIAMALNKEGIAPPRGGEGSAWSFSTISGNVQRGIGILNNELYVGKLVWNRQQFLKDPDTGKRQARPNPPEDWIIEDVPHLRIIDADLWQRVKERQGGVREAILMERANNPGAPGAERGRRPRYLFSGLLRCGCCGSGMSMISATHYGCSANRNKGTCSNSKTIARVAVEDRVLNGLKHQLMHPDLVKEFIQEYQGELRRAQSYAKTARAGHALRLQKAKQEIENIVSAVAQGMFHISMQTRLAVLEAEQAQLEASLADLPEPEPVTLHPGIADIYASKVADLATALNTEDTKLEAADVLRGLIESINLRPEPRAPNAYEIEIFGQLGAIMSLCGGGLAANAKTHASGVGFKQLTLVAGAGFGLTRTFGTILRYSLLPKSIRKIA